MPQKKMGQHGQQHMMVPSHILADFLVVHTQLGSLNLSQFVATLQSAPEKEARGKSTEENGHETVTEAPRPLGRLALAGAVYA